MSMAEKKNHKIMLIFQRVVWREQINYDNENLVLALFHQVLEYFINTLINIQNKQAWLPVHGL